MANVANFSPDQSEGIYNLLIDRGVIRPGDEGKVKDDKSSSAAVEGKLSHATLGLKDLVRTAKTCFSHLAESKSFLSTPLGQALKNDPDFKKLTAADHGADVSSKEGAGSDADDVKNIFLLILKFMKGQNELNNSAEMSAGLNSIVQGALLDKLTTEAVDSINTMKSQIESAKSDLDSPKGQFLSIGLPIMMAVVSMATAGAGGAVGSAVGKGVLYAASASAGAVAATVPSTYVNKLTTDSSSASSEGSAEMSLNSNANTNANNTIQLNSRSEQSAESNKEANNNLIQQMISNYSRLGASNA